MNCVILKKYTGYCKHSTINKKGQYFILFYYLHNISQPNLAYISLIYVHMKALFLLNRELGVISDLCK